MTSIRMQAPAGGEGTVTGLSQPIATDGRGQALVSSREDVAALAKMGWTQVPSPISSALAAPAAIAVGDSPFTYENSGTTEEDVVIAGGTVSSVAFLRGVGSVTLPIAGMFTLSPGDSIEVTYSGVPTITVVAR